MAAALAAFTCSEAITPAWLLALTFGMGIGNAAYSPAWQAIVPNLVPRQELRSAILLNSISMNASRAVGPAVGGLIVAAAGPGMAFVLNAVSFLGIILVLARWKRERPPATNLPPEQFIGAILAGVRYVRHTPDIRVILWRALAFVSGAAALWALLPAIAREHVAWGPAGYGIFLGCLGCGAVTGIWILNRPRQRLGSSWTVTLGGLLFGLSAALLAWVPSFEIRCFALVVAGGMWLSVMTTLNSAAQLILPEWVRARAMSIYLLVFFGGMALASAGWGLVASSLDTRLALMLSALWLAVSAVLTLHLRISDDSSVNQDLSHHWPDAPSIPANRTHKPVLISIEYRIEPDRVDEFLRAVRHLRQSRLRGGALAWGIFQDSEDPKRFVETFVDESWLAHLRRHDRVTAHDQRLEAAVLSCHAGLEPPKVSHLLYAAENTR